MLMHHGGLRGIQSLVKSKHRIKVSQNRTRTTASKDERWHEALKMQETHADGTVCSAWGCAAICLSLMSGPTAVALILSGTMSAPDRCLMRSTK